MKKLNATQMENLQGGLMDINLCQLGLAMSTRALQLGLDGYMDYYVAGLNLQSAHCG